MEKIEHPETGYPFPDVCEIEKIEFQGRGWSDLPDFPVPAPSWDELLNALSPSQRDEDVPPPWTVLGVIRIVTTSGNEHWVSLYLVGGEKEVGAFSAGPSEAAYNDFRGGNSRALSRVVRDAYALYMQDGTSGAGGKGESNQGHVEDQSRRTVKTPFRERGASCSGRKRVRDERGEMKLDQDSR